MAQAILNRDVIEINGGNDSIVIINALGDLPGGRTLDVSGVAADTAVIKAGHVLVQNDTTKEVSPLGVTSGAYDALPAGSSYIGVLKASVLVSDARAAILTVGQVNAAASPYPVTAEIKAGLPQIQFLY